MIQRKLAAKVTIATAPMTIVLFDHRPLCSGGGSEGSERRLKRRLKTPYITPKTSR
jgi:hypothetical protein